MGLWTYSLKGISYVTPFFLYSLQQFAFDSSSVNSCWGHANGFFALHSSPWGILLAFSVASIQKVGDVSALSCQHLCTSSSSLSQSLSVGKKKIEKWWTILFIIILPEHSILSSSVTELLMVEGKTQISVIFINSTLITFLRLSLLIWSSYYYLDFSCWFLFISLISKFWSAQESVLGSLFFSVPLSLRVISSSLVALNTSACWWLPNLSLVTHHLFLISRHVYPAAHLTCLIGIPNLMCLCLSSDGPHKPASPVAFIISVNAHSILLAAWGRNLGAILDSSVCLTPNIWSISNPVISVSKVDPNMTIYHHSLATILCLVYQSSFLVVSLLLPLLPYSLLLAHSQGNLLKFLFIVIFCWKSSNSFPSQPEKGYSDC